MDSLNKKLLRGLGDSSGFLAKIPIPQKESDSLLGIGILDGICYFSQSLYYYSVIITCQALAKGKQNCLTNGPRASPRLHTVGTGWLLTAKSGATPRHEWVEPTGKTGDAPCLPRPAGFDWTSVGAIQMCKS